MKRLLPFCALLLANAEVPSPVRAMLDAAYKSGNEGEVATVVKYAQLAAPDAADEIAHEADAWRADRARAKREAMAGASPLELWTGRAEVGGFVSSGNSDVAGLAAVIDLQREGVAWRHKLRVQADYQRSNGDTSRERFLLGYEPNLHFDDRAYLYGAGLAESDRFLGYDARFSASVGAGYGAIRGRGVKLDVELGPAYRYTSYTDERRENSVAARGSLDLDWRLTDAISVRQDASAYLQRMNSTVASTTALNAKLFGPLSAQLSYAVQYESAPPAGRRTTDTTSRASLVYSF